MLKMFRRMVACGVLFCFVMMIMPVASFAAAPTVKIVVSPNKADIQAGSAPLALTAQASGSDLKYQWTLIGPGKIDNDNLPSVFYMVPEKISQETQALITIIVTDKMGQEATKTITFNILPMVEKESSSSIETESKGMGTRTKVILGAGAVAALGGGLALALGGDDSSSSKSSTNLTLDLSIDRGLYHIGEKFILIVQASMDCYITVYDIDTQGITRQIFPNEWKSDNLIRGGQTYRIPSESDSFDWVVTGPIGVEQIRAEAISLDSTQRAEDMASFQVIE